MVEVGHSSTMTNLALAVTFIAYVKKLQISWKLIMFWELEFDWDQQPGARAVLCVQAVLNQLKFVLNFERRSFLLASY